MNLNASRRSCVLVSITLLLSMIALLGKAPFPIYAQTLPPTDQPLFVEPDYVPIRAPGDVLTQPLEEIVVRERYVGIDTTTLDGDSFTLNLFDDINFVTQKRSRQRSGDGLFWLGTADGSKLSSVNILLKNEQVRGSVAVDGQFFTLIPVDGTIHLVREILQTDTPDDPGGVIPDDAVALDEETVSAQSLQSQQALDGVGEPQIDVLVLWTVNARTLLAGSTRPYTDMEEWINYAFQITNQAYDQSTSSGHQVKQRLRLVHAQEVTYTDNLIDELGTYLTDLHNGSNSGLGALGMTKSLEEMYRADLVVLIVADNSNSAGLGYLPDETSAFSLTYNESITRWEAIFPNYTFAHELGHNMGLHHNRESASTTPYKMYGYGYRSPTEVFRTVMAYNCANGCPRVGYFSNPEVTYTSSSESMGIAIGQADEAHNAQALIDSANLVSNYRTALYDIAIGDTYLNNAGSPDVFSEWGDSVGNESCVDDQDGGDDVAGIDDVARHCVASNQVDQLYFLQSIDDVDVTAGDLTTLCTLIDTEPDLFINYAICSTIVDGTSTPNSEVQTTRLYSCGNSSTSGCVNPTYVKDYNANLPASGGHYINGLFFFGNSESGPFGNDDSQLEIQVPFADLGGLFGSTVCTKLSTFGDLSTLGGPPQDQVLATNQYLQYDTSTGSGTITVDGCGGIPLEKAELVSPINNIATNTPDFVFNAATNATDYTLVVYDPVVAQIIHSGTFSASICSGGLCTAQPGWNLTSGNYLWLVQPEENGLPLEWVTYSGS